MLMFLIRHPHPRTLLALWGMVCLVMTTASGQTTLIEKLQDSRTSIVTVKGQIRNSPSESPDGGLKIPITEQTGAGVVIDPQGLIATNTHIIYGSQTIRVILQDGTECPARIVFISPIYDFSILQVQTPMPLSAIAWGDSDQITLGQKVLTIGHSPILQQTISEGEVVGLGTRTAANGKTTPELLRLNINHYQGDSGGPVLDEEGRLIALVSAKRLTVDRSALAIPANKIHFAYLNLVKEGQNK